MGKFDKQIVCVHVKDLLGEQYFQGFVPSSSTFNDRIKRFSHARRRGDVEEDPAVKQLIGYALIVHPSSQTVFAFQRSADAAKYGEARLYGKWSWGVGGHTDQVDGVNEQVMEALRRELAEEVGLKEGYGLELLGYINDDRETVGKVHFGVLYLVKVDNRDIKPVDGELAHGRFMAIDELRSVLASPDCAVETWSAIALEPLAAVLAGKAPQSKAF